MTRSEARAEAGRLLIVGLPGPELEAGSKARLARVRPGGVILFGRNVETVEQLHTLVGAIRRTLPGVAIYVDAEGGRVDRFRALLGSAVGASALAHAPPRLSRRAGRWMGHALRLFDCDVNFAPVVDLDVGEVDNALDGRYLGAEPHRVVSRARAFLRGLADTGVGGCLKHFPGLGPARADTHLEGAAIQAGPVILERGLEPYAALGAEAGAVMVGHATYPAFDRVSRPASLSPAIAGRLLRERLGFEGAVFTDDLDMHALDVAGDLPERSVAALRAGCDALSLCASLDRAEEVVDALARPSLAQQRQRSSKRLRRYRRSYLKQRKAARAFRLETVKSRLAQVRELAEAHQV